jgi:hypothetical protein
MGKKLPDEIHLFVEKIINDGSLKTKENLYFKKLVTKYIDVLDPDLTHLFKKIIIDYDNIPDEFRDKLLLYISNII